MMQRYQWKGLVSFGAWRNERRYEIVIYDHRAFLHASEEC